MKKGSAIASIGCLFVLGFVGLLGYLIWEVWHIFGFWRIFGLSLCQIIVQVFLLKFATRRIKTGDTIVYDPRETPLYAGFILGFGFVFYLYTHLQSLTNISDNEYWFGIAYLTLSVLGTLNQIRTVYQNRNDKVELSPTHLSWLDIEGSKDLGKKLAWTDIKEIASATGQITVTMTDDSSNQIITKQMNMITSEEQILADIRDYMDKYGNPPPTSTEQES